MKAGSCFSCQHLSDCQEATNNHKQLIAHKCAHWRAAAPPEVEARERLLQAFGAPALCCLLADRDPSAKRR